MSNETNFPNNSNHPQSADIPVESLAPFTRFCCTLGMIPSSYKASMTYEEQLMWLCNYLENTVIPTVNNNTDVTNEMQGLYNELHDYVEHYFDNLDVQQEINNKLDTMAEDGTLISIIAPYLQPFIDAQNQTINNAITSQNNRITQVENFVGASVNINPLVASSLSDMTDTSRIYVLTTDGHWYYYNGSQWTDGGTYQSSGIANYSITGEKTTFLNEGLNKLKFDNKSGTLNGITYILSNGILSFEGTATTTFYLDIINKNQVPLTGLYRFGVFNEINNSDIKIVLHTTDSYVFEMDSSSKDIVCAIRNKTIDKLRVRINENTSISNLTIKPMLMSDSDYNLMTSIGFKQNNDALISDTIYDIGKNIVTVDNTDFIQKSINLVNPSKLINGYANNISNGNLVFSSGNYKTAIVYNNSNLPKNYYVYPRYRLYGILNYSSGEYGSFSNYGTSTTEPSIIEVPPYSRLNVSFYKEDLPNVMIAESDEPVEFVPFQYTIPFLKTDSDIIEILKSNVLYNKKYVALGDSFTHGDFTNSPNNDYYILNGLYAGQYKVYPFLIGNRNLMNVSNLAVNGMTLAYKENRSNSLIESERYKNLDNPDYITLKIGINDENQNIPIGTLDSSDTSTFYGAWNEVLTYLITNYPQAKIGIIVTNGLGYHSDQENDNNYANAIIQIAKKYGIAYLNEWNDFNVPTLIRTAKLNVPQSIRNIRANNWYVSTSTNSHPNAKCHEYESTIVENFLRSL